MKKILTVVFLVFLGVMCLGTVGKASLRSLGDVYIHYGGGIKGLILTVLDRSSIENAVKDYTFLHDGLIELYGASLRAAGVDVLREEDGKVLARLEGDVLVFVHDAEPEFKPAQRASIEALHEAAVSSGAECFFVCIPQKICPGQSRFCARGIADGTAETDKTRMAAFAAAGYSVLDMHARMHDEGLSHPDLYYRTDHHWTPQAALWAAGELARALGVDDALLAPEKYTVERHPRFLLGSEAKHFGDLYCPRDDFDFPLPDFDTELTFQSEDDAPRTGTFAEALLFRDRLTGNPFKTFPYAIFLNGDYGIQSIRNLRLPQGKRILLVKDSFSNPMACYLSLVCAEVDLYDPRHADTPLTAYIRDGGFDAVLVTATSKLENDRFHFQ